MNEKHGRKTGLYPIGVYYFNDLWRKEMIEATKLFKNRGQHPLHTEQNECTIDFNCCADLDWDDPVAQEILGKLTKMAKKLEEV